MYTVYFFCNGKQVGWWSYVSEIPSIGTGIVLSKDMYIIKKYQEIRREGEPHTIQDCQQHEKNEPHIFINAVVKPLIDKKL